MLARTRRLSLGGVLLVAGALRLWRLEQNGFDNEYYAAAVKSMSGSWHNLLYASFDPAGFVSVDKPPVALWIQAASVRLLGFHWWSVVMPQVLEGLATVALVCHLVARRFGAAAGLLAGLFLAVTPISVATDRSGNTDSCLVLVLALAAWALLRAAETASRPLWLLSMALVGLGFNVKMLAAFVPLPTFALVYLLNAVLPWRRRCLDLILAGIVLAAVSLPWALAYDFTPVSRRPFAGSSRHNSMVELAVGHNAIDRFVRPARVGDARTVPPRTPADGATADPTARARTFVQTPTGALRLADGLLAAQVGWLFPLALVGVVAGSLGVSPRRPLHPAHLSLILWSGWALTYGVVYSAAGGIFHFYYLDTMAPPLAALAGIGARRSWALIAQGGWRTALLPVALLVTAVWQAYVQWAALDPTAPPPWAPLYVAPASAALLALALWLATRGRGLASRALRHLAAASTALAVLALLVLPLAWALSSVLVPGIAVLPSADLSRLGPAPATTARARVRTQDEMLTRQLAAFLVRNRQGERFLLATSSVRLAAPIIIETGEPVMARGGYHGLDPILTPEELARLVDTKQVRFAMLGDLSAPSRRLGGEAAGQPVADWVRAHGRTVDPALWRPESASRRLAARLAGLQLYDLRPDPGL
jgi:4-amino-4-deoxy-L-arabinose transferase-like glycosyltransferase